MNVRVVSQGVNLRASRIYLCPICVNLWLVFLHFEFLYLTPLLPPAQSRGGVCSR